MSFSLLPAGHQLPAPLSQPPHPVTTNLISEITIPTSAIDHLRWARMIARGIRERFHFQRGSQEEQDLEATAYLTLVELVERFDPGKIPNNVDPITAFRGWAVLAVRCRCQREALRLRNGGTYHTRREKHRRPVIVERLKNGPEMVDPHSIIDEEENDDEEDPW